MTRIAVLGANGQVGAELCLLLARQPGVEVVPVCRSRMGSAYLRSMGQAVRHGQVADEADAPRLIGDCTVVANLALVSMNRNPAEARATNERLLRNVAGCAATGARHIYFSTMSVYGDAEVGQRLVFRNSYAADKWRSEGLVRGVARRSGQPTWIFRLGHVTGELQGISRQLRSLLQDGPVGVPDPDRLSNTTEVAAIAAAVLAVAAGRVPEGTWDLMNTPPWSWREVLDREGKAAGVPPRFVAVGDPSRPGPVARVSGVLRGLVGGTVAGAAANPLLRRLASRAVARLPDGLFRRLKAAYAVQSARRDLRAANAPLAPLLVGPAAGSSPGGGPMPGPGAVAHDAMLRVPLSVNAAPALPPTAGLLADPGWAFPTAPLGPPWPADLPPAGAAPGMAPAGTRAGHSDPRLPAPPRP